MIASTSGISNESNKTLHQQDSNSATIQESPQNQPTSAPPHSPPQPPSIDLSNYILLEQHTTLLHKREDQLATLAKSNAKLQELNDNLNHEKSVLNTELNNYIEKFNTCSNDMNKLNDRYSTASKNAEQFQKIINEKEESIRGLLAEGEKLSKQQMQHQQANKKLRIKNKEYETENNSIGELDFMTFF